MGSVGLRILQCSLAAPQDVIPAFESVPYSAIERNIIGIQQRDVSSEEDEAAEVEEGTAPRKAAELDSANRDDAWHSVRLHPLQLRASARMPRPSGVPYSCLSLSQTLRARD